MFRTLILTLAVSSAPAAASSHYRAEPAAKPAQTKLVLRDTIWRCGDAGCAAPESNSRPLIVCQVLAKEIGELRSFTAGTETLTADQLRKCNERAR